MDVYVSPTGNDVTGDGSQANPLKTISAGIMAVYPNGTLHITAGTYNEHNLIINTNMNIIGDSAASTIINAQSLGNIFNISTGTTVTISNLTLENGLLTGNGGAINNAGTLTLTGNNLLNNAATGNGGTVYNTGTATINYNRIIGTGNVIASPTGSVSAINNWWGSNSSPSSKVSGTVDVSKWLVLTVTSTISNMSVGGTSTITANLTHNNLGEDTSSLGHLPDGTQITFNVLNTGLGNVNPTTTYTTNGTTSTLFTGLASGLSTVNILVDSQTLQQQFKVGNVDLYVRNYEWYPNRNDKYSFGEAAPYVSYVMNTGPDDATNVTVKYAIGSGLIYEGYSNISGISNAIYNGQTLTYYVNYLPTNGVAVILIYLQVNATGTQTTALTTNASLQSVDQNENGPLPNYETRSLTVANAADIQVTQDPIIYNSNNKTAIIRIHVTNNGPNQADGITITDNLPNGLTEYNHTAGETYTNGIWNIGTLTNGSSITLEIDANVTTNTGTLKNTATKTTPTLPYDWNLSNNAQTQTLTLTGTYTPTINLTVRNYEWYPNRNDNYSFGEAAPYVSYVMNTGDDTTNIVVKYTIGSGLIYEGYTNISGISNAVYDGQNLTYYVNYLPTNGVAVILIYLQVNATGTQTTALTTNASLISYSPTPTSETRSLTVPPAADIQVNQTVNNTQGIQTNNNQNITLSITVTNNGPNTCNNITITDTINGLTYITNDQNATYNPTTQQITWNIPTLNPGQTTTLNITIQATNNGTYKPYATKTAPTTPYDPNMTNNAQTTYITRTNT